MASRVRNEFEVTVNGRKYTRKTEREYTHVVIGAGSLERAKAALTEDKKLEKRKAAYERFQLALEGKGPDYGAKGEELAKLKAKDKAEAVEALKGIGSLEEYLGAEVKEAADRLALRVKSGGYQLFAVAWAENEDDAKAALEKWKNQGYLGLEVVKVGETISRKEPNGKAA